MEDKIVNVLEFLFQLLINSWTKIFLGALLSCWIVWCFTGRYSLGILGTSLLLQVLMDRLFQKHDNFNEVE